MERLDFRSTTNGALIAELRRHAGSDNAGAPGRPAGQPVRSDVDPRTSMAGRTRSALERLAHGPAGTRLDRRPGA